MNKRIAIFFAAFSMFCQGVFAQELILVCKVQPGMIENPPPDSTLSYTIKISLSSSTVIDNFKKEVPISVTEDLYTWKLRVRDFVANADDLTWLSSLNRFTGEYKVVSRGYKGDMLLSRGFCRKAEQAF